MGPFPIALLVNIVQGRIITWIVRRGLPWLSREGWDLIKARVFGSLPSRGQAPQAAAPPLADLQASGGCPDCGGGLRLREAEAGGWEAACRACGRLWRPGAVPAPTAATPAG